MDFYLIRHPAPAVPDGVCYGAADVPLAQDPALDAERLRPLLPARFALHASPLQRCRRLALLLHPAPQFDARLREMDFGAWEQQSWSTLPRELIERWAGDPLGFCPPGGESATAMARRTLAWLDETRAESAPAVVVVGHGGPLRIIACALLGRPVAEWSRFTFCHGGVTHIALSAAGGELLAHNRLR